MSAEYQTTFDESNDIVKDTSQTVSSGIWSEGTGSLTSFFTSSTQSGSNGQYYFQIYNKDTSDSTSQKQFSVLYGHKGGSGSAGKPGVDGNRETAVVYGQMLNLTQPPDTELFTFENGTDVTKQHIFVIAIDRARMREKVDPGNWELRLGNPGANQLELIDDSSTLSDPQNGAGVTEYNIVSGSIQGGSTTIHTAASSMAAATGSYGKFYPDLGLLILSAHALEKSLIGSTGGGAGAAGVTTQGALLGLNALTGSNVNAQYSHSLHRFVQALNSGSMFQARREEAVSSTHYFCRVVNNRFNYSSNPTYGSSSMTNNVDDPKSYITSVALYGDSSELPLAVAKLSKPILKSKSREALIKVKLDF
tara:strand:- start:184 stop:1272 length:1089 start_codon:yes stop_codon:yes gene_type:complete